MYKILFRFFVDYDKEEKWLNKMEAKGYHFHKYCLFFYIFTVGEADTYTYRIELLENMPGSPESVEYLEFLNETGIEYVQPWYRWVYLRKKKSLGPFESFTDRRSKLKHLQRILSLQSACTLIMFINIFINMNNMFATHNYGDSKTLFTGLFVLFTFLFFVIGRATLKTFLSVRELQKELEIHED